MRVFSFSCSSVATIVSCIFRTFLHVTAARTTKTRSRIKITRLKARWLNTELHVKARNVAWKPRKITLMATNTSSILESSEPSLHMSVFSKWPDSHIKPARVAKDKIEVMRTTEGKETTIPLHSVNVTSPCRTQTSPHTAVLHPLLIREPSVKIDTKLPNVTTNRIATVICTCTTSLLKRELGGTGLGLALCACAVHACSICTRRGA
mmetsp:Transcript_30171/g.71917  ORF Transcript_30171/g.71917 Transcript_30171/m.71917 type:complete len:207 (+) Transcript_30171:437-1057(+)